MINAISHRLGVPTSSQSISPAQSISPTSVKQPLSSTYPATSNLSPSVSHSKASKERIAANFGQSAQTYQAQAHLQRECAHKLLSFLDKSCRRHCTDLPEGPILEIGCGTGFITQHLISRFLSDPLTHHPPKHPLHITDLSPDMVQFCQHHVTLPRFPTPQLPNSPTSQLPNSPTPTITFSVLDAETSITPTHTYSLIMGGFVAQWFKHLPNTVAKLLDQLKPGGCLVLSFPGHQSFPEWRERCDRLHLPYTAHPLPNPHTLIQQLKLSPHQYDLQVEMCPTYYNSAKAFFKSMKIIGAGASDADHCLSPKQMRQLLRKWQPTKVEKGASTHSFVEVHYEVVYLSILKE